MYPKQVLLHTLRDGTPIYATVNSEEEYEQLLIQVEDGKEQVRNYFMQYP